MQIISLSFKDSIHSSYLMINNRNHNKMGLLNSFQSIRTISEQTLVVVS